MKKLKKGGITTLFRLATTHLSLFFITFAFE